MYKQCITKLEDRNFEEFLILKNEIKNLDIWQEQKKKDLLNVLEENYKKGVNEWTLTQLIYNLMLEKNI